MECCRTFINSLEPSNKGNRELEDLSSFSWNQAIPWMIRIMFVAVRQPLPLGLGDGWEVVNEASWCTWEVAPREAPAAPYEQVLWSVPEGEVPPALHHLLRAGPGLVWDQPEAEEPRHHRCSAGHPWPRLHSLWEAWCEEAYVWGFRFRANTAQSCVKGGLHHPVLSYWMQ